MIRGIYTAASALRAATTQQGRLAHNLANIQTTGFKQTLTARQAYEARSMSQYDEYDNLRSGAMGALEQGLLIPEEIVDYSQGTLQSTNRPLDLALQGAGFFRIQTPNGERYTRDGSFHSDALGRMVTRDGYFVLNEQGQPIGLPAGELSVTPNGTIFVNAQLVDQLGIAVPVDGVELARENNNLYRGEGLQPVPPEQQNVQQGYLEGSNVDENAQVMEMMRILRLYEASQRTLQAHDRALDEAIAIGEVR